MKPLQIVVWDNIGNVLLGVQPWERWGAGNQARLLREDPAAVAHAPSLAQILADWPYELHHCRSLDEVAARIESCDYLVTHKERLPAEVLLRARQLQLLQHLGLDYRGLPMAAAQQLGVPVCATPLVNYLAVAEHTWALLLEWAKQLPAQRQYMTSRAYLTQGWGAATPGIRLVRDLTLGLAGLGEIARAVARIAQAFEMRCIYWDIERFPALEAQYGVQYVPWDELWSQSDVLSVHLALNDKTEGIIGEREIGRMKPTAYFINTARGKLVDQAALVAALQTGRLGGAGLDVMHPEPPPTDDPIVALHEELSRNVNLTSHSAWQGPWTWIRDSQEIWFNVRRHLRGEPLRFVVAEPKEACSL